MQFALYCRQEFQHLSLHPRQSNHVNLHPDYTVGVIAQHLLFETLLVYPRCLYDYFEHKEHLCQAPYQQKSY
jgi:hypothetical protein